MLTKEQDQYFKDSKIRDESNNLKVVYHGTDNSFDSFDGIKTEPGYWFTEDKDYANSHGEKVLECYLNIKNPFDFENADLYEKYFDEFLKDRDPYEPWDDKIIFSNKFGDFLKAKGHDGMMWLHSGEYTYIAFEPNQIKAVDNLYPTKSANFKDNSQEYFKMMEKPKTVDELIKSAQEKKAQKQHSTTSKTKEQER